MDILIWSSIRFYTCLFRHSIST